MKKITLLLLLLQSGWLFAQEDYTFSTETSTYASITDGDSLRYNDYLRLPFTLKVYDTDYDSVYIDFAGVSKNGLIASSFELNLCYLASYESKATYKIEGTEGKRIVKIQFSSIKFEYDSAKTDVMEGQLWLHEGSNRLELRYGPAVIKNKKSYGYNYLTEKYHDGFLCGFRAKDGDMMLKGDPKSPDLQATIDFSTLNGHPEEGRVYAFNRVASSIDEETTSRVSIYPNPSTGILNIDMAALGTDASSQLNVLSSDGRLISSFQLPTGFSVQNLDLSHLSTGLYLIELTSDNKRTQTRFVIER